MTEYITCDAWGCYESRWHSWGRWVFLALTIIGFLFLLLICLIISARRRRRVGLKPLRGTGWLAPRNRFATQAFVAQPGPVGPAGYYPPPPHNQGPDPYGNYYTPPPYTPSAQFTGTTADGYSTSTNTAAYYAPPPNPPPSAHAAGAGPYEMEMQRTYSVPGPPPAVPVSSHPTGSSYVQSNNPFQPPPAAHVTDAQAKN